MEEIEEIGEMGGREGFLGSSLGLRYGPCPLSWRGVHHYPLSTVGAFEVFYIIEPELPFVLRRRLKILPAGWTLYHHTTPFI
jgi:hypothetical protein